MGSKYVDDMFAELVKHRCRSCMNGACMAGECSSLLHSSLPRSLYDMLLRWHSGAPPMG